MENALVVLDKEATTLASTNLENVNNQLARNLDGKFPDMKGLIPKKKPKPKIKLGYKVPRALIDVASQYAPDGGDNDSVLTFEFREPDSIVVVRAKDNGQEFTGLIMPVS